MAAAPLQAQQFGYAFIELVIPHRRDREPHRAHRLDGRFVVRERRNQRRRADDVAGRDDDGIRILRGRLGEVRRQVLGAASRSLVDQAVGA